MPIILVSPKDSDRLERSSSLHQSQAVYSQTILHVLIIAEPCHSSNGYSLKNWSVPFSRLVMLSFCRSRRTLTIICKYFEVTTHVDDQVIVRTPCVGLCQKIRRLSRSEDMADFR